MSAWPSAYDVAGLIFAQGRERVAAARIIRKELRYLLIRTKDQVKEDMDTEYDRSKEVPLPEHL